LANGTASGDAVNYLQLGGDAARQFLAATATTGSAVVNKDQFDAKTGISTTTVAGIVEKATQAEMNAGTADKWPDSLVVLANAVFATSGSSGFSLRLPDWLGGYIFKCGLHIDANPGDTTITFPSSFPNNCFGLLPVPEIPLPTSYDSTTIKSKANSAVVLGRVSGGTAGTYNIFWMAMGN
jgi:hypothetical protein